MSEKPMSSEHNVCRKLWSQFVQSVMQFQQGYIDSECSSWRIHCSIYSYGRVFSGQAHIYSTGSVRVHVVTPPSDSSNQPWWPAGYIFYCRPITSVYLGRWQTCQLSTSGFDEPAKEISTRDIISDAPRETSTDSTKTSYWRRQGQSLAVGRH
jgi:hypothetical protein